MENTSVASLVSSDSLTFEDTDYFIIHAGSEYLEIYPTNIDKEFQKVAVQSSSAKFVSLGNSLVLKMYQMVQHNV
ncbi:hypothetical protein ACTXT7_005056 [Hymenolepis weldensis]